MKITARLIPLVLVLCATAFTRHGSDSGNGAAPSPMSAESFSLLTMSNLVTGTPNFIVTAPSETPLSLAPARGASAANAFFSLIAYIQGPTKVPYGIGITWSAVTTNGTAPFSYEWSGVLTGSGSSVSGALTSPGYLSLLVRDSSGQTATNSIYITVCGGPYPAC